MSAYQADWYVDEEGLGVFDEEGENEGDEGENEGVENVRSNGMDDGSIVGNIEEDEEEEDDNASMMDGSIANTITFANNDNPKNNQTASAALLEKKKLRTLLQAKDDKEFPDELDTPADVSARLRFARYRALQSFRSSPWHPKENLPTDYARIYQFENFGSAQRRILAEGKMLDNRQQTAVLQSHSSHHSSGGSIGKASEMSVDDAEADDENDTASICTAHTVHTGITNRTMNSAPCLVPGTDDVITSGQYVTFDVEFNTEMCESALIKFKDLNYLSIFSLLKHENKLSVMHCNVQRNEQAGDTTVIKSKEELFFQVRYSA